MTRKTLSACHIMVAIQEMVPGKAASTRSVREKHRESTRAPLIREDFFSLIMPITNNSHNVCCG